MTQRIIISILFLCLFGCTIKKHDKPSTNFIEGELVRIKGLDLGGTIESIEPKHGEQEYTVIYIDRSGRLQHEKFKERVLEHVMREGFR